MNREYEVIELGVASADTRGSVTVVMDDEEGGWKPHAGLTND